MSSGFITLFAMLAFLAIVIWVFLVKRKEDFDEQANLPLDEDDRHNNRHNNRQDNRQDDGRKQDKDKEKSS